MNSYTINKDLSLYDALVQIEQNHHRSLIVLNEDNKVVGSLSDGDIRRALINRIILSSKISNTMNLDYIFVEEHATDSKVENTFLTSDIFILPTHNECFPLVLLEAMQFNLPLISTYEGAIPEIIEDGVNGFLIKKRDSVDLANKIQLLITNPSLRKNMGGKGKAKFEKKYTSSHFEKNMTRILHEISK